MQELREDDIGALLRFAPYPMLVSDSAGLILHANERLAELLGFSREDLRGMRVEDLVPAEVRHQHQALRLAYTTDPSPRPMGQGLAIRARHREGHVIPVEIDLNPCVIGDGQTAVLCTVIDITLRRQAQLALSESEQRYREIAELAPDIIFRLRAQPELELEFVSAALETVTGYSRAELDEDPERWLEIVHPDDRERLVELASAGSGIRRLDLRLNARDGSTRCLAVNVTSVTDADGRWTYLHGTARDVTEQRETRHRLEQAEAQLLQAQKLEAIGRLAGGVAHDFNNLLTVIMSFGRFVVEELSESDPLLGDMQEILGAADRAAALTQQLLAFSRKRAIVPRVMDVSEHVRTLTKMLARLLGEDIVLQAQCSNECWPAFLDAGALEQVLINLAVNARDAMHSGGRLTIRVTNRRVDRPLSLTGGRLLPGDYIQVDVEDTGSGIDDATMTRIFDPFFTTKPAGQGTGLGLATCYGIVQQAGGQIGAQSRVGHGTTFTVLFPRTDPNGAGVESAPPPPALVGDRETVLVVEDDEQVRAATIRILERLGYRPLTAETVGDALLLCEQYEGPIEVLLTDVVMPRMNGRDLAQRMQALRPGLRVLYMSGYTADVIVERGSLGEGERLLDKPFSEEELARALRAVIDQPERSP